MPKELLTRIRHRRILLDRMDCEGIAKLMRSGFTLQETLSLLETPANRAAFEMIIQEMEKGIPPDRFFPAFCPREYRAYLSGFLSCLPFGESLSLCAEIVAGEEQQRKEYVQGLFYPCMMFLCTVAGVTLFNEFCFPPLLSLLESFHTDPAEYDLLRLILRLAGIVTGSLLLGGGIAVIWCRQEKHRIGSYLFFAKHMPSSVYVQYESADFIRYFLQCIRMAVPTKESLRILQSVPHRPVISFLAGVMEKSLQAGDTFSDAVNMPWLDPSLLRFMKIASYSSEMESMLEGYLEMAKERSRRQCRRITRAVQILSYGAIGTIVILIYQIMLLPMKMLGGI